MDKLFDPHMSQRSSFHIQKTDYIQFNIIEDEENQQNVTSEKQMSIFSVVRLINRRFVSSLMQSILAKTEKVAMPTFKKLNKLINSSIVQHFIAKEESFISIM